MKKDDNSGVAIKQIFIVAVFAICMTFGGLKLYQTIYMNEAIELANLEESLVGAGQEVTEKVKEYECALVENTEEDVVHSEKTKFLAVHAATQDTEEKKEDISLSGNSLIYNQVSRGGNYRNSPLLQSMIEEMKELGEKSLVQNIKLDVNETETKENEDKSQEEETKNEEELAKVEEPNQEPNQENNPKQELKVEQKEEQNKQEQEVEPKENVNQSVVEVKQEEPKVEEVPSEYVKCIDMKATAYCLCRKCCGKSPNSSGYGVTASGLKIVPGNNMKVIAVDPKVIPLGTKVYVQGLYGANDYGYAVAADTGGAIKNKKIDLYMDTHQMALNWGVKNVKVYILEK